MAGRRVETFVKRAREQALREKRERKQAKKDARVAERAAIADGTFVEPAGDDELEGGLDDGGSGSELRGEDGGGPGPDQASPGAAEAVEQ